MTDCEKVSAQNYVYEITAGIAPDRVVRMVGIGHRVLELGSGPGSITRHLAENHCQVTALDVNTESLEIVSEFCESAHHCDLNLKNWHRILPELGKFDVVVAADVFEHLMDPWSSIKLVHHFLGDHGSFVLSLPHVGHASVLACLVNSDFEYRTTGLLDKTHIRFFGLSNIQLLLEDAGFKIIEAQFVVMHPKKTEFSNQWDKLSRKTRKRLLSEKAATIYQVVLRAVPANRDGIDTALQLIDLPVPKAEGTYLMNRLRNSMLGGIVAWFIPSSIRAKISSFFRKFGI